jgi:hypothetical protein
LLWVGVIALAGPAAGVSGAEQTGVPASRDSTLIESAAGDRSNGAGPVFFVGRTSQPLNSIRRGLLAFDLEGWIPAGSVVTAVTLELELTPSNTSDAGVSLHRVLDSWGEGASSSSGGGGAAAQPDDATWLHRYFDAEFWALPGGDFVEASSASIDVGGPGVYAWSSTPELVADVQAWVADPAENHGWLLIGDEGGPSTAKRFVSREGDEEGMHPRLWVDFTPPCTHGSLQGAPRALCRNYCEVLGCAQDPPRRGTARACERISAAFAYVSRGLPLVCGPTRPDDGGLNLRR